MANIVIDSFDTLGASTEDHVTDYEAYSDPRYTEESLLFRSLGNTEHTMGIKFLPRDINGVIYVPSLENKIYYRVRIWFMDKPSRWYDVTNIDCDRPDTNILHVSNLIGDLGILSN